MQLNVIKRGALLTARSALNADLVFRAKRKSGNSAASGGIAPRFGRRKMIVGNPFIYLQVIHKDTKL